MLNCEASPSIFAREAAGIIMLNVLFKKLVSFSVCGVCVTFPSPSTVSSIQFRSKPAFSGKSKSLSLKIKPFGNSIAARTSAARLALRCAILAAATPRHAHRGAAQKREPHRVALVCAVGRGRAALCRAWQSGQNPFRSHQPPLRA